jgi:hypothetical protein
MTFYDRAAIFSPALVRLLARDGKYGEPLDTLRIQRDCNGLFSHFEIEALSQATSWKGIDIERMQAFTVACGIDLCDSKTMRRVTDYFRKDPTFKYLMRSKRWGDYYRPLLIKWRKSYGIVTATTPTGLWAPLRKLLIRLNPLINAQAQ